MATDPTAQLFVDGQYVGTGTASFSMRKNRGHSVMAKLEDRAGTTQIDKTVSTTGILDLVGGFLFLAPFIGVVAPGFWELDRDNVVVVLPPASAVASNPAR